MKTTIYEIVTGEMKRQKMTGYRLAKLCGLPQRSVYDYLAGTSDILAERLRLILDALGLEIRRKASKSKG